MPRSPREPARHSGRGFLGLLLWACALPLACDPNIVIGTRISESNDAGSSSQAGANSGGAAGESGNAGAAGSAGNAGTGIAGSGGTGPVNVIWSTSVESADISDWERGGPVEGGLYEENIRTNEVSTERARTGEYGIKMTIDTEPHYTHLARYYRRVIEGPGYYSGWFFFDAMHTPDDWWAFLVFRGQADPADFDTNVNLWDVNLREDDGKLHVYLYDHLTGKVHDPLFQKPVPIAQWVHFEAYLEYKAPDTAFKFWQDDELVIDVPVPMLGKTPVSHLFWAVGNGSNGLVPPVSTLFMDDLMIADGRVGRNGPRE